MTQQEERITQLEEKVDKLEQLLDRTLFELQNSDVLMFEAVNFEKIWEHL